VKTKASKPKKLKKVLKELKKQQDAGIFGDDESASSADPYNAEGLS